MMYKLSQTNIQRLITLTIAILFCTSLWQLASASWIQAKALVAQQLLSHSWDLTINNEAINSKAINRETINTRTTKKYKPWPWADTWPIAKLISRRHDVEHIILAGDSGNSLAFAPGYSFASALPNTSGTTVISAHRDTHFSFLKDININDTIHLQTVNKTIAYRIYDLQVVDSTTYTIQADSDKQTLILVTCYPFDALSAGGTQRYLVMAKPIASNQPSPEPYSQLTKTMI